MTVKQFLGVVSAAALIVGLTAAAPALVSSASPGQPAGVSATAQAPHPHRFSMQQWAREATVYGDADTSAYDIDHVTELQYRLSWAHALKSRVNGNFGKVTRAAVKRYQKKEGLRVTGRAGQLTWAHLIHDTIRHRAMVPRICHSAGWHACYDRSQHQVTLWHFGNLRNAWLVRGGEYGIETRLGNSHVYYRDIDHVSTSFGSPMPYAQFFDGGQAYHGSPFMVDPFEGHSHGCINMYIEDARQLWRLTSTKRLNVSVYGAWDKVPLQQMERASE